MSKLLPPTEGCISCASAYAEIARLRALLDAPSAQMSDGQGNLIPIDSGGMRQVIDDNQRLRAQIEKAEAVVREIEKWVQRAADRERA